MVDNVNGVGGPEGAGHARKIRRAYNVNVQKPARGADKVEMTSEARELSKTEGIRWERVMEIRRALQNGTYLDPDKLDVALDRAIDEAYSEAEPESER